MSKKDAFTKPLEKWQEQKSAAYKRMTDLRSTCPKEGLWVDSEGKPDNEKRAEWEKANDEYDSADEAIREHRESDDVRKRMADMEEQDRRSGHRSNPDIDREPRDRTSTRPTMQESRAMFGVWARRQFGGQLNRRDRELCKRFRFNPTMRHFQVNLMKRNSGTLLQQRMNRVHHSLRGEVDIADLEKRALSASTATAGAEMVGRGLVPMFERAMLHFSGVLQACDVFRTANGETIDWPTLNDTSNKGAQINESAAVATNVDPATAEKSFEAYKFTSKCVLVPYELIEDDSAGLIDELPSLLGERLGRILEEKFTTGSGTSTPNGVVTASSLGPTATSATAIEADDIIELEHSVDFAYRSNGNVGYMAHDLIIQAVRLLKNTSEDYIWRSGLEDGVPDRLNGYPIWRNQEMASSMAADAKVMLFGNFSKYKARIVRDVRFYRLEERYRDNDQDGFVAFIRADGDLLNAGVAPIKHLKMAAA